MRIALAAAFALAFAPAAGADSIAFATTAVDTPTHLVQTRLDGSAAHTLVTTPVFDYRSGHTAGADGKTLLVDGKPVATVQWPIDDAQFAPATNEVAFTAVNEAHCGPAATNCATWELWLVRRDGSGLRELSPDGRYPRFSPDGRRLAFLGGYSPLGPGGTAVAQSLATGRRTWFTYADDAPPSWAPDSDRLSYSSHGRVRIGTVAPRRLQDIGTKGFGPQFSPDGRYLAYGSGATGLAVRPSAGGPARLVATESTDAWTWAPGDWLVYTPIVRRYPTEIALARVRADGLHRAVLRTYAPTTYFDFIRASQDALVFQITRVRQTTAIRSVDPATGLRRTLADDLGGDASPTAAPNGRLAYTRGSSMRAGSACLVVDGRCVVQPAAGATIAQPSWSPDGTELAFLEQSAQHTLLEVAARDGSGRRVLARFVGADSPTWSPDGSAIVVAGSSHLWRVATETGVATELDVPTDAGLPSWSPDGSWIAFVGGSIGANALELYDVATGAVRTVTAIDGPSADRPAWSPDASHLAYEAADDSLHVIGRDGTGDRELFASIAPGALDWLPG